MATPQTPLLLYDNIFDRINLYTQATLLAASQTVGHEVRYAADYRRERTYWLAQGTAGISGMNGATSVGSTVAGSTTINLTAGFLSGYVVIGDTFILSGTTYTIQAAAATNNNNLTVSVLPAVPTTFAAGAVVSGYTAKGNWIMTDLGAGNTAQPDSLWLDRGHNLAGNTVVVEYSDDSVTWTTLWTLALPAVGVTGQNPSAGPANTDEGATYYLGSPAAAAHRYWRVRIPFVSTLTPAITGVILGVRFQSPFFSKIYDEDAGARSQIKDMSQAGWQATARTYSWRTCEIDLSTIDVASYDNKIRALRQPLFEKNQPVFIVMEWGNYPNRGYLFQYDDTNWTFSKTQAYRDGRMKFRELYSLIT